MGNRYDTNTIMFCSATSSVCHGPKSHITQFKHQKWVYTWTNLNGPIKKAYKRLTSLKKAKNRGNSVSRDVAKNYVWVIFLTFEIKFDFAQRHSVDFAKRKKSGWNMQILIGAMQFHSDGIVELDHLTSAVSLNFIRSFWAVTPKLAATSKFYSDLRI